MSTDLDDFRAFTEFQEFLGFLGTCSYSIPAALLSESVTTSSAASTFPVVIQSADYSCGRASLMAICQHLGYNLPPAVWETLGTNKDGTSSDQILRFARSMGWSYDARDDRSIEDLECSTADGIPVLCAVTMYGGSHWVVVYRVDRQADRVDVMDPVEGLIHFTAAGFLYVWDSTTDGRRWLRYGIAIDGPRGAATESLREAAQEQAAHATAPLAAHARVAQHAALDHTDEVGEHVAQTIGELWARLQALLEDEGRRRGEGSAEAVPASVLREIEQIARAIQAAPHTKLREDFVELARRGHDAAAAALKKTLPTEYVRVALAERKGLPRALGESIIPDMPSPSQQQPGLIQLGVTPTGELSVTNQLDTIPDDAAHEDLLKLLFPPLPLDRIASILLRPIAGKTWEQDLSAATKLADPHVVAGTVAGGFAAGKTPAQVAKLLEPVVDGVASSAKRIARTYGMQIAHRAQMDAHAQLGDLVIGYQIHALLDAHTRPEHAHRNGTIYYINPEPGQLSMDDCPHPPLEADGSISWNCRCWTSPVLKPLEALRDHPAFAEPAVPTQHTTHDEWFASATEEDKAAAVGWHRYGLMRELVGAGQVTGSLPTGRQIEFIPHPHQRKDETMVLVDPQRLSADWSKNRSNYLPPESTGRRGESEVGGRRAGFRAFQQTGAAVQAPKVGIDPSGRVDFDDGRHRFAVLRDQGIDRVAITVPRNQVEDFQQRFGATALPTDRGRPGWEHFVDPVSGSLLSAHRLKQESAAARAERVLKVRATVARNRQQLRQVARMGFV